MHAWLICADLELARSMMARLWLFCRQPALLWNLTLWNFDSLPLEIFYLHVRHEDRVYILLLGELARHGVHMIQLDVYTVLTFSSFSLRTLLYNFSDVGDSGLFKHLDLEAVRFLLNKVSLRIHVLASTSHLSSRKTRDFLCRLNFFSLRCCLCSATVSKQIIFEMVSHWHTVAVLL